MVIQTKITLNCYDVPKNLNLYGVKSVKSKEKIGVLEYRKKEVEGGIFTITFTNEDYASAVPIEQLKK
jgi:hypothetical protein